MAGRPGAMGPPRRPDPNARRSSARIAALRANPNSQAAPTDNQSNPPDTDDLRPRSEVEPSDFEPESAVEQRVPTTSFSVATKRAIERDGTDCWHCNSSDALEHIHVLGRTRSTVGDSVPIR